MCLNSQTQQPIVMEIFHPGLTWKRMCSFPISKQSYCCNYKRNTHRFSVTAQRNEIFVICPLLFSCLSSVLKDTCWKVNVSGWRVGSFLSNRADPVLTRSPQQSQKGICCSLPLEQTLVRIGLTAALEQRGAELRCFSKISVRRRNRPRSPHSIPLLLLQWLLYWAHTVYTHTIQAMGTSGLATSFKGCRYWEGISGCVGLWSLFQAKPAWILSPRRRMASLQSCLSNLAAGVSWDHWLVSTVTNRDVALCHSTSFCLVLHWIFLPSWKVIKGLFKHKIHINVSPLSSRKIVLIDLQPSRASVLVITKITAHPG